MVCPTCRRIYPEGVKTCTVDGTALVPEVGDFPTGFDDDAMERMTPAPGQEPRPQPPTQKYPQQSRPSGNTNTPVGREGSGSVPRSLTDSNRHTPMGREISTPRVVLQDLQIAPGDLIADYQVTGRLGEGGMGTVYAGVQPVIGKQVAIKVLLREFASNAEVVNRFIQEARAANQARSRYIVDIFSFGELNDGRHYFVMEHLVGKSLREVLTEKKVVAFDEAYSILTCMAKGLMAAHGNGIIHRDIKPENIMVIPEEDGTLSAKTLDFGIAKLQGTMANPDFQTKTGAAMGTPFYMSPEQCRGVDVDHRTDIYALGIIMFEMFTGQLPFKASSYIELVNKHLFASPPDMRALNPEISAQLEAFVQRCIAKNPDERPQTMKQFLSELKELVPSLHRTHPSAAHLMPVMDLPAGEGSVPSVATGAGMPARKGRLWVVFLALAAVVLGGGSVGAYLVWKKGKDGGPSVGTTVTPPARADAQATARMATLKVSTTPPGAAIFINGKQIEQKSPTEVTVAPGTVQLRIVLDGYAVAEKQLELDPGVLEAVSLALSAKPAAGETGGLKLQTNVKRATFFLDGTIVHQGPALELGKLEAKPYSLKITAPKHEPLEQGITVLPGKVLALDLTLKRRRRAGVSHTKLTKTKKPPPKKGTTDDPDSTLNPFKRKK